MNSIEIIRKKILDKAQLTALLNVWKLQEKQVVFTNGCFDILHLGHVDYLSKAADLGDKLVVGVNSDSSTNGLKGPGRPITDQASRSIIMASLLFVDAVILFDEPTPIDLIRLVKPDVLVKGSDYSIEQIVGGQDVMARGGRVETIDFLPGYSTSLIEKKIFDFKRPL